MTFRTSVRAAHDGDTDLLADWAVAMAWETEHKPLHRDTVRRGIQTVLVQPQRGRYFIAERDGVAAGTLMLTTEWSDWRCADWWWIQSVYVAPAYRRGGIYTALYRHVHHAARNAGDVCGLRLYVERDNLAAQHTYMTLGMADAGYAMFETLLPQPSSSTAIDAP